MESSKLYACNIHQSIRLSPLALKIVDTPEFQRLRRIKQLGIANYVFPTANHTRFEHSIGVYHLTEKMLDKILLQYPDRKYSIIEMSEEKIPLDNLLVECIKIGGLCHDIGHGPFSHVFDNIFRNKIAGPLSHHEARSCAIVEIICKRVLGNVLTDAHIEFIKSIIAPKPHHKGAIYQIVANYLNGIDVDKFDYLLRDSKNTGLNIGFEYHRLLNEIIVDANDNIVYPKHCSTDIYELFHSRYMMHKKVYNHKTNKIVELMLKKAINLVDPIFEISNKITDMTKFCDLVDDTIYQMVCYIKAPPPFVTVNIDAASMHLINKSFKLFKNIESRNFYKQIFEFVGSEDHTTYINGFIERAQLEDPSIQQNDFITVKYKIGFVSADKPNPFDSIFFYDKKEGGNIFTLSKGNISCLLGEHYQEVHTHVIYKKRNKYAQLLDCLARFNNAQAASLSSHA